MMRPIPPDQTRVSHYIDAGTGNSFGACDVKVSDHRDLSAAAGAAENFFLVALEHGEHTTAHGTYAQKAYLDRFQIRRCHVFTAQKCLYAHQRLR